MSTHTNADPDVRGQLVWLLEHYEASAAEWTRHGERAQREGRQGGAALCAVEADLALAAADRVRMRLVALSGLTEGDVAVSGPLADLLQRGPADSNWQAPMPSPRRVPVRAPEHLTPEPPAKLMDLYAWLRKLLGSRFPWVTSESWQRVAFLLLVDRRRQP